VWPLAAELGEGPCWVDGALWFVDIMGQMIHRLQPDSGASRSWAAPARVSFALPMQGGDFVVGLPGGLHRFDPGDGTFSLLAAIESGLPHNRTNDACVAPDGALWFGTLNELETEPTGALYRWDGAAAGPQVKDGGYVISNGPAFSPDGKVLYHTDTLQKLIYAFDVGNAGQLSGKRAHIRIEDGAGWPDGSTVDAEGCLWIALWDGGCVRRYSASGVLLQQFQLPCARVTKLAFGGDQLRTVYVTTALKGLSSSERAKTPLGGGVFALQVDAPGLAQHRCKLRIR
jgi:sugar lactone lactonase YvrE